MSYHIQINAISTNPGGLISFPSTAGQASPDGLYVLYVLFITATEVTAYYLSVPNGTYIHLHCPACRTER